MIGRAYVAPAGTDDWQEVGVCTGPLRTLPADSPWLDQGDEPPLTRRPLTIDFGPLSDADADVLTGAFGARAHARPIPLPPSPEFRVEAVRLVSPVAAAPVKRKGLTGKAYRAARRRHGRQVKAWRRAGSPMRQVRTVIPRAVVTDVRPIPGAPGTVSVGCRIGVPRRPETTGD